MLRGGIVGLGKMGITHFSILGTHPHVKFVAACDRSFLVIDYICKNLNVKMFNDYRKMLNEVELDFLIVTTPPATHADIVEYAIQNNLNVFVEKPFVIDTNAGQKIIENLKGRNLANQVGYVLRFSDIFMEVKKLLSAKIIGDVISYKVEMAAPTVLNPRRNGWRGIKTNGGGCLHDFSSHGIDLINYFFGIPDRTIGAVLKKIYSKNTEDAVYCTFIHRNKLSGQLIVTWSDPSWRKATHKIEILGTHGKIIADLHACRLFLRNKPPNSRHTKGWSVRYITDLAKPVRFYVRGYEYTRQLDYFIDCILQGNRPEKCSFKEALETDMIINDIIRDSAGKDN